MNTDAIRELFLEALDKEKYVLELYSSIIKGIREKEIIDALNKINNDEVNHIKNINEIFKLLSSQ